MAHMDVNNKGHLSFLNIPVINFPLKLCHLDVFDREPMTTMAKTITSFFT